eukprot:gnl/TRDRNA2_/TRDRNA2_39943_c0_seq1.p1 gnl/TRDRNA2_/TRDRNA2_39943_c0~~gnl/TRDRNA2_/TRDRNA2_39943_c0_seq1.p1  ORF type:complete len:402 (-),score=60.70 gnl/TRDRNA2_/TRDRNA2_39943_c0_seq1:105-1310(-)
MEVTVLDVRNAPTKPVLAIHAGSVRRQARLELNQPFVIPHPGTQPGPVQVTLFQQLASQVLRDDGRPEAFCSIPVRNTDGASSQVKIRVRRGDTLAASDDRALRAASGQDSMSITRDYLNQHQLQQRIQSLIQDVLREQPDDPYKYMLSMLRKSRETERKDPKAPSAAKPPLKPSPPQGGSPTRPQRPGPQPKNSAAATSGAAVPRPPEQPAPSGRPQRHLANQPKPAQGRGAGTARRKEELPKTQIGREARWAVMMALRAPLCLHTATLSKCSEVCKELSCDLAAVTLQAVREKLVGEVMDFTDVKSQAFAAIRKALSGAAQLLSHEYRAMVTRFSISLALQGALSGVIALGGTGSAGLPPRRASNEAVPKPIVALSAEPKWSEWLEIKTNPTKLSKSHS